jgi:hypothetical protein
MVALMKRILLSIALLISGFPVFSQETDDWLSAPSLPDLFNDPAQTGQQTLQPGRVVLTGREIDLLILGGRGSGLEFPSIDAFTGNTDTPLQFRRISLFAPSSTVWVAGDELKPFDHPRPRHFYVAGNSRTGVGLAVDPVNGTISGFATQGGDKFEVDGNILGELQFLVIEDAEQGSNSCSTELKDQPVDALAQLSEPAFSSDSAAAAGESITYQAVVAVDTDTEWLAGFNNNETAALDWIADAFLAMNVFYERDVETRLLIGDVILRIGSDPYSVPSNRFDQLNEFGTYWKNNMGSIDREFAAMFSGRSISGGSFSGIAWINQYCDYGHSNGGSQVAGSYSYNAIGSTRSPGSTALFIGHELGHNMGSVHTHCYSPPVDQCYNGESGCYSGTPQCPAGGRGTVMSYCHVGGSNGAGCGSNAEFHTRVQSLLESRLSAQMANGCIAPYSDPDPQPQPEFSSNPIAGSTLDFGDQQTGTESPDSAIQVTNLGEASLTLSSCNLSGAGAASFNINACPASIAAGTSASIQVSCQPASAGTKSATLTVSTNDSDESSVNYSLGCAGQAPPEPEFESSPVANSTINFGNQVIAEVSQAAAVEVSNSGGQALLLTSCDLGGPDASSFNVVNCPGSVPASGTASILINCEPDTLGQKAATLTVHSNDGDEGSVTFGLGCRGVLAPEDDQIFTGGFETAG